MEKNKELRWTRRQWVRAWLTAPASLLLTACLGRSVDRDPSRSIAQATGLPPTALPTSTARSATVAAMAASPSPATERSAPTVTEQAPIETSATPTVTAADVVQLQPTPMCGDDDDDPTLAQTEGPYFTPNSPERASLLEAGMTGTRLNVSGFVLSTSCQPIAGALIDFWQCDDGGIYDNSGYRLRGHQFTDDQGRYTLETILPGLYPGRTRHIHVKVQAPNQPVLTTQVYFPGEPANDSDGIFHPALLMQVQDAADAKIALFDYVLDVA